MGVCGGLFADCLCGMFRRSVDSLLFSASLLQANPFHSIRHRHELIRYDRAGCDHRITDIIEWINIASLATEEVEYEVGIPTSG